MPADRLLNQVLADYQSIRDERHTDRLFGTTLTLLTELTNPLNLTLLTSQFLTAPAIWHHPPSPHADPLRETCLRVLSVFNTAAIHVRHNELDNADKRTALGFGITSSPPVGGGLTSEAWARAVVKGADERSSRWQHLLVLVGILMGFEGNDRRSLSGSMRRTLEGAVVTAANLSLRSLDREPPVARPAVVLALNWAFPLMSEQARLDVDCDALLPVALQALVGRDGFQGGMFLGVIGTDIRQIGSRLEWPETSGSFMALQRLTSKPLVETAGPLSQLIAFAVEKARDHRLVLQAQDDLVSFTATLLDQWRHTRLAEIEASDEEALCLMEATFQVPWPAIWRFLTNILFAAVAILRGVTARGLLDPHLRHDAMAPVVAAKTLHIYRNLYFISSRGNDSFQVYTFSYLTSIDILARYAAPAVAFLRETVPMISTGPIPTHALQRTLDLFYLNTAEHLPLNISPEACESLIVQPATAYLSRTAIQSQRMTELFEAAHAAILSVLSCPQNGPIAVKMAPFYAEALLESFPSHISPRQFRLAFSTLMQILSPPFPVSGTRPELGETLLEMVRFRIPSAGQGLLSPATHDHSHAAPQPMSEQGALVLTLIDALPFLPPPIVEEWMNAIGRALHEISDPSMREAAKHRFWEILGNGEMDVERAAISVAWWGTKGGRELVLFGPEERRTAQQDMFMMSGALGDGGGSSKL
ncbi:hypothetical protein M406DRAFT_86641 [Cryphonectria parasitica EP155]|uniref:Peroxisomal membrane protein PEX17 n=1 Tax=Cryphonectria parasitica (strain ATCC 38755 / EP155) TaxID=660469 RepID=A0A9P4YBX0_CRYP1|nr:uncharacterized protein M406DRAFT_86641 [Cryphonectria parasitica EP155]KAF3769830.1 hypothetical protein M406DRAFT_86641 [Cryphonectria parasitica EP155]